MRRRASRAAIFAAVVAAHLLALHFFPDFRPPPEVSDQEPSLPITFFPVQSQKPERATPRERQPASRRRQATASSGRTRSTPRGLKRETRTPSNSSRPIQPWIDWDKEADAAVADRTERAAEAARRAGALSRWREHVMPAPWVPHGPEFRWDYAATHRVVVTRGRGIVININDRCFLVFIGLAVIPGCRIGKIPAYGHLFAHMDDPKRPADFNVP